MGVYLRWLYMEINCLHFDSINSTNTWSKENYKSFDPSKITMVTADQQTSGHGRYNRPWLSPAKQNIYATFTFFLPQNRKDLGNIAQITALSIVKTIKECGLFPLIKWPNDILIDRKKISGILCEVMQEANHSIVFVGIGLNVNMPPEILQKINQPAASLLSETGKEFDVQDVLHLLKNYFAKHLKLFIQNGFFPFLNDYRNHVIHQKGDLISAQMQKGLFQRIDDDGTLIIEMDGKMQKINAGEIDIQ